MAFMFETRFVMRLTRYDHRVLGIAARLFLRLPRIEKTLLSIILFNLSLPDLAKTTSTGYPEGAGRCSPKRERMLCDGGRFLG
jgi:hypothetical protein